MKKKLKVYGLLWLAFVVLAVLWLYIVREPGCEHDKGLRDLPNNPSYIENVVEMDLPDIVKVDYERGVGSHWISEGYLLQFNGTLSKDCITELEKRCATDRAHWSKNYAGDYIYTNNGSGYNLSCIVYGDHLLVDYAVSDGEDEIFEPGFIIPFLLLLCLLMVLLIYGMVLIVIALNGRIKKTRKGNG